MELTKSSAKVLRAFLEDPGEDQYFTSRIRRSRGAGDLVPSASGN